MSATANPQVRSDGSIHALSGAGDAVGYSHPLDPDKVDTSHGPILYLDKLTVSFDGFKALNELSLHIEPGELRGIIGPNGAGKTTMMDVITGKTRPDGDRRSSARPSTCSRMDEHEIARRGIGRKFQKPTRVRDLSVSQNLEVAYAQTASR